MDRETVLTWHYFPFRVFRVFRVFRGSHFLSIGSRRMETMQSLFCLGWYKLKGWFTWSFTENSLANWYPYIIDSAKPINHRAVKETWNTLFLFFIWSNGGSLSLQIMSCQRRLAWQTKSIYSTKLILLTINILRRPICRLAMIIFNRC